MIQENNLTYDSKDSIAIKSIMNEKQTQRECDFFRSQHLLKRLLTNKLITQNEFDKILDLNCKKFSPFLSELM